MVDTNHIYDWKSIKFQYNSTFSMDESRKIDYAIEFELEHLRVGDLEYSRNW